MAFTEKELEQFNRVYGVPQDMAKYTERLFTPEEIRFALTAPSEIRVDGKQTLAGDDKEIGETFLQSEYRRGFLNLKDEKRDAYVLSDYAGFMDVYVVREFEDWQQRFTKEERHEIDLAYFHASFDPKAKEKETAPTRDEVWPLDEVLDFIDRHEGQIYLNNCDCRSFAGDCGKPRHTCITWLGGINTYADRGMSEKLTKEQAREKVREFDRAGLMHTLQADGDVVCNCCGDCCYLSRGRDILQSGGSWPKAHYIVSFEKDPCIGCGLCTRRCWRGVFTIRDKKAVLDTSRCVGCGLCVNSCPKKALSLVPHQFPQWKVKIQPQAQPVTH